MCAAMFQQSCICKNYLSVCCFMCKTFFGMVSNKTSSLISYEQRVVVKSDYTVQWMLIIKEDQFWGSHWQIAAVKDAN